MYPYFKCNKCNGQNISLAKLILEFESFLDRMRVDQGYLDNYSVFLKREIAAMGLEATKIRNTRTSNIQRLEKDQTRLLDLLMKGTLTDEIYDKKMQEISFELSKLRLESDDSEEEIRDIEATISYLIHIALEPRKIWCNASNNMKLDLQRLWIPDGIYFNKQAGDRTTLTLIKPTLSKENAGFVLFGYPEFSNYKTLILFLIEVERIRIKHAS